MIQLKPLHKFGPFFTTLTSTDPVKVCIVEVNEGDSRERVVFVASATLEHIEKAEGVAALMNDERNRWRSRKEAEVLRRMAAMCGGKSENEGRTE